MELTPPSQLPIRSRSDWPNTITFPKELREAIPHYAPRALVFDAISGAHYDSTAISNMMGRPRSGNGERIRLQLLVHETGKLDGKFNLNADLDTETTRALGKFLIELADRADAERN